MDLTGTTHPPAGAMAAAYVLTTSLHRLGWLFIPSTMFSSFLLFVVAVLLNNVFQYRKPYPVYYF